MCFFYKAHNYLTVNFLMPIDNVGATLERLFMPVSIST